MSNQNISDEDISDEEALEIAIAFGDPAKFEESRKRIEQATADNQKFYKESDSLDELLIDDSTTGSDA